MVPCMPADFTVPVVQAKAEGQRLAVCCLKVAGCKLHPIWMKGAACTSVSGIGSF